MSAPMTLKPCAHCGDDQAYIGKARGTSGWFIVVCYKCGASSGPRFPEEAAADAWNLRAASPPPAEMAGYMQWADEPPPAEPSGEVETWESINQWCDDTFGKATVPQIIARAKEEFEELESEGADHAIEAADVVICLCRVPGFAEALAHKMAINRKRKWRLTGDGTGYHIPEPAALTPNAAEGE